jgi:hypothetical protein
MRTRRFISTAKSFRAKYRRGRLAYSLHAYLLVFWLHGRWWVQLAHYVTAIKSCSLRLRSSKWRHAYWACDQNSNWRRNLNVVARGRMIRVVSAASLSGCAGKNVPLEKTCRWTMFLLSLKSSLNKHNCTFSANIGLHDDIPLLYPPSKLTTAILLVMTANQYDARMHTYKLCNNSRGLF